MDPFASPGFHQQTDESNSGLLHPCLPFALAGWTDGSSSSSSWGVCWVGRCIDQAFNFS
jgi:hypothetical protein